MAKRSSGRSANTPKPRIPQELYENLRTGNCVLFAGSGLSARAGLPTWTELLSGLIEFGFTEELISSGSAESYRAALLELERDSVADGIVHAFHSSRDRLQEYLRRSYPVLPSVPRAYDALRKMPFSAVITGNHDTLLEKFLPRYAEAGLFTPQDTGPLMDAVSQKRPFLLKVYGVIDKPETLIIAPIEYRQLVASHLAFLSFIEGLFVSQTIFFVGLSLDGIQEFLSATPFRGGSHPRKHFALVAVESSAWRSKAELLERRFNVTVIPYSAAERHKAFEDFLVELAGKFRKSPKEETRAEPAVVPGIRKLVLEDIGSFERLELDFAPNHRWKLLLGDNGVGKSTVLKAIAVAVIGNDARSYAGRLVRAGKTLGRITVMTDQNPGGYITEILIKDTLAEAEVISRPARCLEAEGWLAIGFSPLRSVSWRVSTGPQAIIAKGRFVSDDLIPLLSGEVDARMDRLKQWLVNLDASNKSLQSELRGHRGRVSGLAFSPDGATLFSGSLDKSVRIWDVSTGQSRPLIEAHRGGVNGIAISADGQIVASGSYDRTVVICNARTGRRQQTTESASTQILSVGLNLDGSFLAWGSESGTLRTLRLGKSTVQSANHNLGKGEIWSLAVSRDAETIFAACEEGVVSFSTAHGTTTHSFLDSGDPPGWSLALSPDGFTLVTGTSNGRIFVWDVQSGKLRSKFFAFNKGVLSIAISENGQICAAGSESGQVRIWDLNAGKELLSAQGSTHAIWSVALSPDGQTLAAGGDDSLIRLIPVPRSTAPTQQKEVIEKLFGVIATLTDRADIQFIRVNELNRVLVSTAEAPAGIPLEMLSQGLTSLLGWVGYVCQRLKETDSSITPAPLPLGGYALILLDEIDAHMHPRWQQVLVNRLKKLFPSAQFIVSTHSPLIAAGMEAEEVVRFERSDNGSIQVTFPEFSLKGMGVAGLLTSDMFGLSSQLDEDTAEALNRKRQLTGLLLRGGQPQRAIDAIRIEIEALNERLRFVDATTAFRDPLYARFVELMAEAGQTDVPTTSSRKEERRNQERTAQSVVARLKSETDGGPQTA
jgi:WD40 repeat protein